MNRILKRELLFLVVAAVLVAGYLYLGLRLAPAAPPESQEGGVLTIEQFVQQEQQRRDRDRFLRAWAQWGAGVGAVLIVAYTLWRPPWFVQRPIAVREEKEKNSADPKSPTKRSTPNSPFGDRISKRATAMMIATVVLLITAIVLVASLFGR